MKFARASILALAVAGASGTASAHDPHISCELHSDYHLALTPDALRFQRDDASAKIELRQGALLVDGRAVTLTPGDREKLQSFEKELRAMMPECARSRSRRSTSPTPPSRTCCAAFAEDSASAERSIARMETEHGKARQKIEQGLGGPVLRRSRVREEVESTVATVVPEDRGRRHSGGAQGRFLRRRARGAEIERKAERMEKEIERDVEQRARGSSAGPTSSARA
jgi:hypothetical protein